MIKIHTYWYLYVYSCVFWYVCCTYCSCYSVLCVFRMYFITFCITSYPQCTLNHAPLYLQPLYRKYDSYHIYIQVYFLCICGVCNLIGEYMYCVTYLCTYLCCRRRMDLLLLSIGIGSHPTYAYFYVASKYFSLRKQIHVFRRI